MMQNAQTNSQGFLALFGYSSGDSDSFNIELLKEVDRLIRAVPFQIQEIEHRAELSLPMLKHISDMQVKIKEPILILQTKIDNLKAMRQIMQEKRWKETVEDFAAMKCDRDGPALPNQVQPQSVHEQIFEEINEVISVYKQFEFDLKVALDTPIKMMHIFRVAKVFLFNQQKTHS